MIEPYHYAGFSVQMAMAKEQRDRDAADELITFAKDAKVLRCREDIFLENAENRIRQAEGSQFELTGDFFGGLFRNDDHSPDIFDWVRRGYATERYTTNGPFPLSQSPCWAR